MKRLIMVAAAMLALLVILVLFNSATSANAREMTQEEQHQDYKKYSCIPECPFFSAWAMTKTCRGVSFNERGRFMFKRFTSDDHSRESRAVFREIVRRESNRYDCRHPGCEFLMDVDRETSVCGYLKWRTGTPLHGEYIDNWVTLHHQCAYAQFLLLYGPPDQSEKETDKICAAADVVEKRLKAWGYCTYGHGEVGRSSKDKKHCYYLKRSREVR